ncbi:hypothetical protein [Bradyrhizobium sp. LHD-71]|uniref:hypothetical protein n=1 Tax=Bradyrhizobium sp. LHD-71 TaxID=3072141 RepID=UPI00280FA78E|nr:hypothetical protein [Bradyrhizobium sp. LHD-71]MDQ8727515.1 hypothetical protein [Bradyrhizobium sp. LHD-71]
MWRRWVGTCLISCARHFWHSVADFHLHLHNQRGASIANYYEGLLLGVREFDTSLGGMGGCPCCGNGRAAGHVPTEDFVDLCHEKGIETGYKFDRKGGDVYANQMAPWKSDDGLQKL